MLPRYYTHPLKTIWQFLTTGSHLVCLMDCGDTTQRLFNTCSAQTFLVESVNRFMSEQEAIQILEHFQSNWIPNGQVLWSGVSRDEAQEWADHHGLQTLTTAMGPLMDEDHPECLKLKMSPHQWSRYIHGASAIFAWCIAQGEKATLLTPPPPERFHPSGLSYYQVIEEPIVKGLFGERAVHKIMICHPMVKESEEFVYELWPSDRRDDWRKRFGSAPFEMKWRQTGKKAQKIQWKSMRVSSEKYICSTKQYKHRTYKVWHTIISFLLYIIADDTPRPPLARALV